MYEEPREALRAIALEGGEEVLGRWEAWHWTNPAPRSYKEGTDRSSVLGGPRLDFHGFLFLTNKRLLFVWPGLLGRSYRVLPGLSLRIEGIRKVSFWDRDLFVDDMTFRILHNDLRTVLSMIQHEVRRYRSTEMPLRHEAPTLPGPGMHDPKVLDAHSLGTYHRLALVQCPHCHALNTCDESFCLKCGWNLPPSHY
jgi:hypothetical protein